MRFNRFLKDNLNDAVRLFDPSRKADLFLKSFCSERRIGKRDRVWLGDRFFFYQRHRLFFDRLAGGSDELAEIIAKFYENELDESLSARIEKLKGSGEFDALFNRSFPQFLAERIGSRFGESAFLWFNSKPAVHIRVNIAKTSVVEVMRMLESEGFSSVQSPLSPCGLILDQTQKSLKNSACYNEGLIELQDESSQLVACLVNPETGNLFDACAGGGGKSLAVASLFPGIKITASDNRTFLFDEIESRAARAGADIAAKPFASVEKLKFDTVLVDAPCSGSGVIRRNPADRWHISAGSVAELGRLQLELLTGFSKLVAAKGELIYATCSFLEDENERVIERFLKENPGFELLPAAERLKCNLSAGTELSDVVEGDFYRVAPFHERDILFGALLRRNF